jgi:phosphatidylglycerophosphate synthase
VKAFGPGPEQASRLAHSSTQGVIYVSEALLDQLPSSSFVRGYRVDHQDVAGIVDDGPVMAISERSDVPWLAMDRAPPEQLSRVAVVLANFVTMCRVPLGGLAALAFYRGAFYEGLLWYAAGLFTDVFDGWIARAWRGCTAWGKRFDRGADMFFNIVSTAGFCAGGFLKWSDPQAAIGLLAVTLGLMVLSFPVIGPGTNVMAKVRSGVVRLLISAFALWRLPWGDQALTICIIYGMLLSLAGAYEGKVLWDEVANNERGIWRGPQYKELTWDHRLLLAFRRRRP